MSRLNWINPENYAFDHMLLLDRFQIHMRTTAGIWGLP